MKNKGLRLFTGLIGIIGKVESIRANGGGSKIEVSAKFDSPLETGESIALDGVCLTVIGITSGGFSADISAETSSCTTLGSLRTSTRINIERALRADSRLGGHFVQGHVDCVGKVLRLDRRADFATLAIKFPAKYAKYIVEKGSIAVSGVSLTVAKLKSGYFEAAVIPETLRRTNLGDFCPGMPVNLEFDVLAKYIEKAIQR